MRALRICALSLPVALLVPFSPKADTGLVMNNGYYSGTNAALTFNSANNTLGTNVVDIAGGQALMCAITHDDNTAFVSGFNGEIQIINLAANPPTLSATTIPISNSAEDLSLTPNDQYLLESDGGEAAAINVINVATSAAIGTFTPTSGGAQSVSVCDNGTSVVSIDGYHQVLNLLSLTSGGVLSETASVSVPNATNNAFCAPGSKTAIALGDSDGYGSGPSTPPGVLASFTLPSLTPVSSLDVYAQSAAFSPSGNVLYVFSMEQVSAYNFNPQTGVIGAVIWSTALDGNGYDLAYYGVHQIAISADGSEVFVVDGNSVDVLAASNGAQTSLTNASLGSGSGICLRPTVAPLNFEEFFFNGSPVGSRNYTFGSWLSGEYQPGTPAYSLALEMLEGTTTQTYTVTNSGTSALTVGTPTITGVNAGDFSIQSNSCGTTVASGGSCSLTVSFQASGAPGSFSASLGVAGLVVPLSGTSVPLYTYTSNGYVNCGYSQTCAFDVTPQVQHFHGEPTTTAQVTGPYIVGGGTNIEVAQGTGWGTCTGGGDSITGTLGQASGSGRLASYGIKFVAQTANPGTCFFPVQIVNDGTVEGETLIGVSP